MEWNLRPQSHTCHTHTHTHTHTLHALLLTFSYCFLICTWLRQICNYNTKLSHTSIIIIILLVRTSSTLLHVSSIYIGLQLHPQAFWGRGYYRITYHTCRYYTMNFKYTKKISAFNTVWNTRNSLHALKMCKSGMSPLLLPKMILSSPNSPYIILYR